MELIVAKGTPAELREFVQDNPLFERAQPLPGQTPNGASPLDPQRVRSEVSRITERALKAVTLIARSAPRVKFERVAKEIGVESNQTLGGVMSSLGHSAQTIGGAIDRDWSRGEYVIDPDAASVILEAINDFESER